MEYIRPASERGTANFGWLDSKHSFSFGNYYDANHMGFSALRVINDDAIQPSTGFGTHPHRDMEIISYVLEGGLAHKDSMGNEYTIPAGDVQRMSAGSGITHSEYNASNETTAKFLQIWILPKLTGIEPSYEQKTVAQQGPLTPLVTPNGSSNSLSINQDASIHRLLLAPGESAELEHSDQRSGYLHVVSGELALKTDTPAASGAAAITLSKADGLGSAVGRTISVTNTGSEQVEALWFDLPSLSE